MSSSLLSCWSSSLSSSSVARTPQVSHPNTRNSEERGSVWNKGITIFLVILLLAIGGSLLGLRIIHGLALALVRSRRRLWQIAVLGHGDVER